jgi:hypothetical protein
MITNQTPKAAQGRPSPAMAARGASVDASAQMRPDPTGREQEIAVAELAGLVAQSSRAVRLLIGLPPATPFPTAPANALLTITGRLARLVGDLDRFGRETT